MTNNILPWFYGSQSNFRKITSFNPPRLSQGYTENKPLIQENAWPSGPRLLGQSVCCNSTCPSVDDLSITKPLTPSSLHLCLLLQEPNKLVHIELVFTKSYQVLGIALGAEDTGENQKGPPMGGGGHLNKLMSMWYKSWYLHSSQDGRVGKCSSCLFSQPHQNDNYSTTIIENHLKSYWTEVLQLRTYRRSQIEPGRRGRDVEGASPTPMCDHYK